MAGETATKRAYAAFVPRAVGKIDAQAVSLICQKIFALMAGETGGIPESSQ